MIDVDINYKQGEKVALLTPRSRRGRFFLSDNLKGKRINNSAVTTSVEQLLALIALMTERGIAAYWKKSE
jgi:hypothetical protein